MGRMVLLQDAARTTIRDGFARIGARNESR